MRTYWAFLLIAALLLLTLSGCASRSPRLLSTTPGPAGLLVEVWQHGETCERRVYVGWSYYGTRPVPCPAQAAR